MEAPTTGSRDAATKAMLTRSRFFLELACPTARLAMSDGATLQFLRGRSFPLWAPFRRMGGMRCQTRGQRPKDGRTYPVQSAAPSARDSCSEAPSEGPSTVLSGLTRNGVVARNSTSRGPLPRFTTRTALLPPPSTTRGCEGKGPHFGRLKARWHSRDCLCALKPLSHN